MGQILIEKLDKYINKIKDEDIRNITRAIINNADDIHAVKPASSTGNYHPVSDLGEGGLVRHLILVAEIADTMCLQFADSETGEGMLERDIIYAAALVHDLHKYEAGNAYSLKNHADKMSEDIRKLADFIEDEGIKRNINTIADCVLTHMSRFAKKGHEQPTTRAQAIVSAADLVAASKELPILIEDFSREAQSILKKDK